MNMSNMFITVLFGSISASSIELSLDADESSPIFRTVKTIDFRFEISHRLITETLGSLTATIKLAEEKEHSLGFADILNNLGKSAEKAIQNIFRTNSSGPHINRLIFTARIAQDIYNAIPNKLRTETLSPLWSDKPQAPPKKHHPLRTISFDRIKESRTGNEYKKLHINSLTSAHTSALKRVLGIINWVKTLTSGHNLLEKTLLYRMSNSAPIKSLTLHLKEIQSIINKGRLTQEFVKDNINEIIYQISLVTRNENLVSAVGFLWTIPAYLEKEATRDGTSVFIRVSIPFYINSSAGTAYTWKEKTFLIGKQGQAKALEVKIRPLSSHIIQFKETLFASNLNDHCARATQEEKPDIYACKPIPRTLQQATSCLDKLAKTDWKSALEICRLDVKESLSPNIRINNHYIQAFSNKGQISLTCSHLSTTYKGQYYTEGSITGGATCTLKTPNEQINITTVETPKRINTDYKLSLTGLVTLLRPHIEKLAHGLSKRAYVDPTLALSVIDLAYQAEDTNTGALSLMATTTAVILALLTWTIIARAKKLHDEGKSCCTRLQHNRDEATWQPVSQNDNGQTQDPAMASTYTPA